MTQSKPGDQTIRSFDLLSVERLYKFGPISDQGGVEGSSSSCMWCASSFAGSCIAQGNLHTPPSALPLQSSPSLIMRTPDRWRLGNDAEIRDGPYLSRRLARR